MDTTTATANRVAAATKHAGFTCTQLAQASGIAYTTLHRKLKGRTPFNVEEVAAIARALDVQATTLVQFEDAA